MADGGDIVYENSELDCRLTISLGIEKDEDSVPNLQRNKNQVNRLIITIDFNVRNKYPGSIRRPEYECLTAGLKAIEEKPEHYLFNLVSTDISLDPSLKKAVTLAMSSSFDLKKVGVAPNEACLHSSEETNIDKSVSSYPSAGALNYPFDVSLISEEYAQEIFKEIDSSKDLTFNCAAVSYTHLTLPTKA